MTITGVVFRPQFRPEQLREVVAAADGSPLDELWLWEDCFDHGGIALASAALAWTQRLRVGVGVLPVPLRNPALAAMETASLHRMHPGRVEIGLGHGVQDWMDQVGARVASPMTLLREYVTAVRALLAGETVSAEGRYVRLRDVRLGWPPEDGPMVHVAASGPKTVALAGELGGGMVLSGDTSSEQTRAACERFAAARPPGAGPGRVTVYVPVADDGPAAAAALREHAAAGADAVILEPAGDADPVRFSRFVAEEVLPRIG